MYIKQKSINAFYRKSIFYTLLPLSETVLPIWFNVDIDYLLACQVLVVYPVTKFDKTYRH